MNKTPNYIKNLLMPTTKAPQGRKAWSIDLETVWIPFFTATNVMGDTAIPVDALGCPLRLGYNKDGSVRFGRNGRPITRVAKPIAQNVTLVRENFVANLKQYAEAVADGKAEEYAEHIQICLKAGEPIKAKEQADIAKAVQLQLEQAMADAEANHETETEAEKTEADRELQPA